ncbi:deleted in lung and esophageal cancer protein 1 homolog [Myxocyprinus asiaticus]|uniref:deleted in lung and esophageal cancer protein 1 homolog n=1 Tax=Myxocyprinus asiaticus TaxID=70543 RepID=UPI002221CD70|nr:deleted in lung and esophageal cancer protein 1 homolog [Myxocyprinus asiaticus]
MHMDDKSLGIVVTKIHLLSFNTSIEAPVPIFSASPPVILFTDYRVGRVYETAVELKNMTATSHHIRLIPPTSPHLSVGLGRFPGEGGIVAPGMSCQYMVRFAPDSLADYEDILVMETQSPYPLIIPVEAHRPPPILTFIFQVFFSLAVSWCWLICMLEFHRRAA